MKTGILIFSGYNIRGIIAFIRFCERNNILYFIIACGKHDPVHLTEYTRQVIGTRETPNLNLNDFIGYKISIQRKNECDNILILPSTEYLNRFLLKNKGYLEDAGFTIPLCSESLYKRLSDKESFGELCKLYGLGVPMELTGPKESDIPFVAKPKKYFADEERVNEKPVLVTNLSRYNQLSNHATGRFYFQEFIKGSSYYLLYYFSGDSTYSVYSQENLIQQNNGRSIIGAKSSNIHQDPISIQYAKMLSELGFRGLIMMEVKFFKDKFYMIEANPRLWGPSQLILDAGMDLFSRFGLDFNLLHQVPEVKYEPGTCYFWSGGIIEDQFRNGSVAFHDYNETKFFNEYISWSQADIYLHTDTYPLFLFELKNRRN